MLPRDRGLFQRLADVFCGHHGHAGAAHVGKDHLTGLHRSGDGGVVNVRTVSDVAAALAAPKAPGLPPDYLALDPELPRWKERLGL